MSDQEDLSGIQQSQELDNYKELDEVEKDFSIEELKESISFLTRKIKIKVGNNSYIFHIVNLSEKKKYGTKSSKKIDVNSGSCSNAVLSIRENQIILPTTEFDGQGKVTKKEMEQGINEKTIKKVIHSGIKRGVISVDEDMNYVHKKEIEVFNAADEKLEATPSSLYLKNSPNEIIVEDTINLNEAFDHDVRYRYILFPTDDDGHAGANLNDFLFELEEAHDPKYLAFKFNFNASYEPKSAFLQVIEENGNEYILMNVGNKIETKYYGLESSLEDVIEIDDDFDFEFSL